MKYERKEQFEKINVFGTGTANTAYAQFFIDNSFLNPLTDPKGGLFAANVTFEPGCRNNWHIHHADKGGGQLLICTAGEGWYQEEGKAAVSLYEGSVVMIPANVKHWHGAKKDSWFSHIAVEVRGEHARMSGVSRYPMENTQSCNGGMEHGSQTDGGQRCLGRICPEICGTER